MRKYIHLLLDTKTFPYHVRTTAGAFCGRHELGLTPVSCAVTPQRLADVLSNDSNTHRDIFDRYNGFLLSPSPVFGIKFFFFFLFLDPTAPATHQDHHHAGQSAPTTPIPRSLASQQSPGVKSNHCAYLMKWAIIVCVI